MGLALLYGPDKERLVGGLLHSLDGQTYAPARAHFLIFHISHFYPCHHTGQQLTAGIGDKDADVIGMRQGVGRDALLDASATEGFTLEGIYGYRGGCAGVDGCYLALGDADTHLHVVDAEDGEHRFRRQNGFAHAHDFRTHDTTDRGIDATVFQVLLGHIVGRLRLGHLALHLHPLHVGQRLVVVEQFHALVGILGLVEGCLCGGQCVTCLGLVDDGQELAFLHGLSLADCHTLEHGHARKTDTGGTLFLHDADVGHLCQILACSDLLHHHADSAFFAFYVFLATGHKSQYGNQYEYLLHGFTS